MNKNGLLIKGAVSADMEKINRYTRREYSPEEVYTFRVVLCDNEVDRDFESFTVPVLKELAELFVGKTGISDHDRKSSGQCARIFDTEVIEDGEKKTILGDIYTRLEAKAYIPVSDSTGELISRIESGILKEVSVGCSVKSSRCSVCGRDKCSHIPGKTYGGKLCVRFLEDAADAYEFSFVAVPAQKNAGVTKSFEKGGNMNYLEKMKSLEREGEMTLSYDEVQDMLKSLSWGEAYREKLRSNVRKYSRIIQPQLSADLVEAISKALDVRELMELEETYASLAADKFPAAVQTSGEHDENTDSSIGNFRI